MAAEYPGALFDASLLTDAIVSPADWTKVVEELRASVGTLGVNPQGVDATVLARLDRLDSLVAGFGKVGFRMLRVQNDATTPNSKVVVTADCLVIEGYASPVPIGATIDITVAGKNGLSTGSEAGNTWYFIWLGQNPTTGEIAGILDPSSTRAGLTLSHASLSGFTRWTRVGAVRNNASQNFLRFSQQDRRVLYPGDDANGDYRVAANLRSAAFAAISLANAVPLTARQAYLHCICAPTGATGTFYILGSNAAGFTTAGYVIAIVASGGDTRSRIWLPTDTSQNVNYKVTGGVTGGGLTVEVAGYEDPVG